MLIASEQSVASAAEPNANPTAGLPMAITAMAPSTNAMIADTDTLVLVAWLVARPGRHAATIESQPKLTTDDPFACKCAPTVPLRAAAIRSPRS